MRRRLPIAVAAVAFVAIAAPASGGLTPLINVTDDGGNDRFDPKEKSILVDSGGIAWGWDDLNTEEHNVVQDKKMFNSGDPVQTRAPFELDPSAGTFPYYCELHGNKGGLGMSGTLRVRPVFGALKRGSAEVVWSTGSGDTGNQFDVQYRVKGRDKWKDWKKNTAQTEAEFGGNDKPISVNPSKKYQVRVRSEKSSNPKKKRSGWSPALLIEFS
jgi:plastocyanin